MKQQREGAPLQGECASAAAAKVSQAFLVAAVGLRRPRAPLVSSVASLKSPLPSFEATHIPVSVLNSLLRFLSVVKSGDGVVASVVRQGGGGPELGSTVRGRYHLWPVRPGPIRQAEDCPGRPQGLFLLLSAGERTERSWARSARA